jgi:DNA-binding transcriptional MocR family regulator
MRTRTLQTLVAELAADIEAGRRFRPGDRLPPQRTLARERGMAASTVSQVYRELARRGLVVGETGRGTYVRAAAAPAGTALTEPSGSYVDLALNVPILPEQARWLADSLAPLLRRSTMFEQALRPVEAVGSEAARRITAAFLSRRRWRVDPDRVIFAGSGKQALSAVVAALVPPGQRLAVDALTYPVIKAIAARLRIALVPIAMDEDGMCPEALTFAHAKAPVRAVYCQPSLHNPVGTTIPAARRAELVRVIRRHNLVAIEDAVYSFLLPDSPPLAALAPERVVLIDSLSKRLAPGLTVGVIVAPAGRVEAMAMAVRSSASGPAGFALTACTHWVADGTAAAIGAAKRRDAAIRQRLLRQRFAGLAWRGDPRSYHAWLTLPPGWRADAFEAAAARAGIAVVPASAFAVSAGHAPHAVRLALASPTLDTLDVALTTLANLARSEPRTPSAATRPASG